MNPAQPTAEAFAVRDGKFLAVGSAAEIDAQRGQRQRSSTSTAHPSCPVFVTHIHFTHYALSLQQIQIFEVPSLARDVATGGDQSRGDTEWPMAHRLGLESHALDRTALPHAP
ncbi:MAG: hypothetical protein R2867_44815 [Caldilineaceae bacterium]